MPSRHTWTTRTLMLVGAPTDFAVEAAEQLVEYFQLGQRGQEIPRLTGALSTLDNNSAFLQHLKLLADGLGVAPAAPQSEMSDGPAMQETTTDESADTRPDPRETVPGQETGSDGEKESVVATPTERPAPMDADTHAGNDHARHGARPRASVPFTGQSTRTRSEGDQADSGGANVPPTPRRRWETRSRLEHPRRAVALPITSGCWSCRAGRDDAGDGDAASAGGGAKDDHTARQAVLYYEKHRGRRAKAMEDLHPGFDVLSIDDNTDRQRRIEVKGTQGLFKEDASVVLTARQAEDAVQNEENGVEYWLYVVDSTETGRPRVFPIRWARDRTHLRYGFHAYAWADAAERPAEATEAGLNDLSLDALDPLDPGDLV